MQGISHGHCLAPYGDVRTPYSPRMSASKGKVCPPIRDESAITLQGAFCQAQKVHFTIYFNRLSLNFLTVHSASARGRASHAREQACQEENDTKTQNVHNVGKRHKPSPWHIYCCKISMKEDGSGD